VTRTTRRPVRARVAHSLSAVALMIAGALLWAEPAAACTVCQCGTTTLTGGHAPQADTDTGGTWIAEVEGRAQRFTMGSDEQNALRVDDLRLDVGTSLRVGAGIRLGVAVPWVVREARWNNGERHRGVGFGDLSAQAIHAWWKPSVGLFGTSWVAVRMPTSPTLRHSDGRRLDHDAQTGAGSWIPSIGAGVGGWHGAAVWRVDVSAAIPGPSRFDYHPSSAVLSTASAGWVALPWLTVQGRVDTRWEAGRALADGPDPNSGGTIVTLSPEAQFSFDGRFFLIAAWRAPVWERLQGAQTESAITSLRLVWRSAPTSLPVEAPWGPMAGGPPAAP
jgi:hypothetical protein